MKRIAIYIDWENLGAKCLRGIFRHLSGWDVFLRRAYGTQLSHCRGVLRENGIMLIEVIPNKPRKNAADIALTIDLMEQLCSEHAADAYGIATADSDFTMVLLRVREQGKQAFLFGPPDTPTPLRQAATAFYPLLPRDADDEARQRMEVLVSEFLASVQERRTVDAFAKFILQRDPNFSPQRFGSATLTRLLKKVGVCSLRPVTNSRGCTDSYELAGVVALPMETGN